RALGRSGGARPLLQPKSFSRTGGFLGRQLICFWKGDMNKRDKNLWAGLSDQAQGALTSRDYQTGSFGQRLARGGVEAGELAGLDRGKPETAKGWIPGVEVFARQVHAQRHRG